MTYIYDMWKPCRRWFEYRIRWLESSLWNRKSYLMQYELSISVSSRYIQDLSFNGNRRYRTSFPLQLLAHAIQSSSLSLLVQYRCVTSLSSTSAYVACLLRIQWLMYIVNVSKSWYKNGRWKSRADPLHNAEQSTGHLSWTGSILWLYSNAYLLLCIEHAICRVGIYNVPCSELRVHVGGWLCSGTNKTVLYRWARGRSEGSRTVGIGRNWGRRRGYHIWVGFYRAAADGAMSERAFTCEISLWRGDRR